MRVAITGASGNIGTSLVPALADRPDVDEIVGIARRRPRWGPPRVRWVVADIARDDLSAAFAGVDVVIHLAWLIQPSRDLDETHRVNVVGSTRVFEAAAAAGASALVHTSSVGAYSPGPGKDRRVDESWPTDGIPSLFYSRQKAYVERVLDHFELQHPDVRVVRIRPSLVGKGESATGLRRLFLGPFLPNAVVGRLPIGPTVAGLRLQLTHADDIAQGLRLAALNPAARGAYNLTAEPILEAEDLARALGHRPLALPPAVARAATALSWRLYLQPTPPGWLDLALALPVMDASRARAELGWAPAHDAAAVLREVAEGLRAGADGPTPPLAKSSGGPARSREVATGIGARNP